MSKNLAVFDFDHTIIDSNSDTVVRDLIPSDEIPSQVKELYNKDGWTSYMQGIFNLFREKDIKEDVIKTTIQNIPPLNGMDELIRGLRNNYNCDTIIISDSNSYFINTWLDRYDLKEYVDGVFTNPASFDRDGLLNIRMYHLQKECNLSTKNLCKGRIMQEFIAAQEEKEITYSKIIYMGDGVNDLCPILRLGKDDLACVRENYKCANLIQTLRQYKPIDATNKLYYVHCKVFFWQNGYDILNKLQQHMKANV